MKPVNPDFVGELWPSAQPFDDLSLYGKVEFSPTGAFEVRSLQTFNLVYIAGPFGIDDTGALKIVFRSIIDIGGFQTTDPAAPNYVTARASNAATLSIEYLPSGHMRPRDKSVLVRVTEGFLSRGDTITITFGDTSKGSPGMQLQTYCETNFEFKVLVDVYATGHFVPLRETPTISVVPGLPFEWRVIAPTLRCTGEPFSLGIRADDAWGNPSDRVQEDLFIESNLPVENLPDQVTFPLGQRSVKIENLVAHKEGVYRIRLYKGRHEHLADANPIVIQADTLRGYWGDLHGQTGETVGINTAYEYLIFARDLAFLDVTSHQGNDFQIRANFWEQLNRLTAEFYEKGRFVTFPGYEWSGNTCVGGDHNVYFLHEGCSIRRSSHALIQGNSDIESDAPTMRDLFSELANEDCIIYAHVGGRYADIAYAHDPKIETALEIHSAWGTFEWLLMDSFALNYRCGIVCNSDDHKCRPGASHPGASHFGTYGGLTCFLTSELTRESIFDCLRRRHHYGTSGNRLHLDVRARFKTSANFYESDPRNFKVVPQPRNELMMGDIAQTEDQTVNLFVHAATQTPIERIEVFNADKLVYTMRGYSPEDLGNRIRVVWSGATYRGRGRQTRWRGKLSVKGSHIVRFQKFNLWNQEHLLQQCSDTEIEWDSVTTGNFIGFDIWLDESSNGQLVLDTNDIKTNLALNDIDFEDIVFETGGLDRKLRIFRMPQTNNIFEMKDSITVPLKPTGDNPIWVKVTTDDGYNAWSSPIFIYRQE